MQAPSTDDPKLRAMLTQLNTCPVVPPVSAAVAGSDQSPCDKPTPVPLKPTGVPVGAPTPGQSMQEFFRQQSCKELEASGAKNGKKQALVVGGVAAGVVFVVSFTGLVGIKPKFVLKKRTHENGTTSTSVNLLTVFIIALVLAVVTFGASCITAFKA